MYRLYLNGHSIHSCQWFFSYFFSFALIFFISLSAKPCIHFKHAQTHTSIQRYTQIRVKHYHTSSVLEFQNESKRIDLWFFPLYFIHTHSLDFHTSTLIKMNRLQPDCVIICTSQFTRYNAKFGLNKKKTRKKAQTK